MKLFQRGLCLLFFLTGWMSWAQQLEVPDHYILKSPQDYVQYQESVEACVKWIIETPISVNPVKRAKVKVFLLKWLSGTPSIKLEMDDNAHPIMSDMDFKYSNDLVVAYLGGMALYQINNPEEPDYTKVIKSGIEAILKMSQNEPEAFKKSNAVMIYRKLKTDGAMVKWIEANLQKRFANF